MGSDFKHTVKKISGGLSLANIARAELIEGLRQCNEAQVNLFKQMYSFKNMEDDIKTVVANMPEEKLDWALSQVDRTLALDK